MNARRKPSTTAPEQSIQERAGALRAATARLPPQASLEALLANCRRYAVEFDFAPFSIEELARLYEITRQADSFWGHIGNMPLCQSSDGSSRLSNIGWFVEGESQRFSFLRDSCVAEITRRVPANKAEHDEILSVRIMHEIDCNGRVDRLDAPDLLLEALKAWG